MMQTDSITIAPRFNGPPESGNGGYVSGRVAAHLAPATDELWPQVTLRAPCPIGKPLQVRRHDETVDLMDGETLIAHGRHVPTALDVPPSPDLSAAEIGVSHFRCRDEHPLPTCFVCGTARAEGDGLRLFTGPFDDDSRSRVAAPWRPHASVASDDGTVPAEIIWAALDCPGAFAVDEATASGLKLLGQLSVRIFARPQAGTPLIVAGWYLGSDGRKHGAGTALFDLDGRALALGRALWIELRPA